MLLLLIQKLKTVLFLATRTQIIRKKCSFSMKQVISDEHVITVVYGHNDRGSALYKGQIYWNIQKSSFLVSKILATFLLCLE